MPLLLLSRYLFFLTRRPISNSNLHYLEERIKGLRSLAGVLESANIARLQEVIDAINSVRPANFARIAPSLQNNLSALVTGDGRGGPRFPRNLVTSYSAPPATFFDGVDSVLLILGPDIGIGDEIIFFPLPGWIKASHADLHLTVLSAYKGLWSRVSDVDEARYYTDYLSLLGALRGAAPFDGADLIILADFERPCLHEALCYEPKIDRFVELSLGTHSAYALDRRRGWLYCKNGSLPYFTNYYFGLNQLAQWLGLAPRITDRLSAIARTASDKRIEDRLRIFVSPFTSKYNPSQMYWSRVLASLFRSAPERPVEFVLDAGPNPATESFASAVKRSAQARIPRGVTIEIARTEGKRVLNLDGVFSEMERAHVVICADSFAAHAAPLFGCTTLVLAASGLENWRVPLPTSFYFNTEYHFDLVIEGMRRVLGGLGIEGLHNCSTPLLSTDEQELDATTEQLHRLFESDGRKASDLVRACYEKWDRSYQSALTGLAKWPREFSGLLRDFDYDGGLLQPGSQNLDAGELSADMLAHLQDQLEQWENTNLRKYLRMVFNGSGRSIDL